MEKSPEQEHKGRNSILSERNGKQKFEVRIRENRTKKSRFYVAKSAGDARKCYKGNGIIMWVNKVDKEKMYNVGGSLRLGGLPVGQFLKQLEAERIDKQNKESSGFFGLGSQLLKQLKTEGQRELQLQEQEQGKGKNNVRGYNEESERTDRKGQGQAATGTVGKRGGKTKRDISDWQAAPEGR